MTAVSVTAEWSTIHIIRWYLNHYIHTITTYDLKKYHVKAHVSIALKNDIR